MAACPDGPVTVGVHDWSSADRQEYWDQVINAFNEANPCIKAETVKLPEDRAVRLKEISAGTAPCLVGFDSSDLPRVYLMGALMDLTPRDGCRPAFNPMDEFFESVYKTGIVDGKPVAIAKDYSVSAFYVNTGLLEKAGIEVPNEGWTYDDYLKHGPAADRGRERQQCHQPRLRPDQGGPVGRQHCPTGAAHRLVARLPELPVLLGRHTISDDGKTTTGYINSEEAVEAWTWYPRPDPHIQSRSWRHLPGCHRAGFNDKLFSQGKLAIAGTYWGPWFQDTFNQARI